MERDGRQVNKVSISRSEMDRQYRVIDLMLTMHSVLRDRNHRRALAVDVLNFSVSLVLVATVFADTQILSVVGISGEHSRYVIGVTSLAIFFLSILTLRIDWKQKAEKHQDAHLKLAALKAKFHDWEKSHSPDNTQWLQELQQQCRVVMGEIPPIPDSKFNGLKAIHLRKVELSKALSRSPGASAIVLRLKILLQSSLKSLRSVKETPRKGE
jgi:hypothetical protein